MNARGCLYSFLRKQSKRVYWNLCAGVALPLTVLTCDIYLKLLINELEFVEKFLSLMEPKISQQGSALTKTISVNNEGLNVNFLFLRLETRDKE